MSMRLSLSRDELRDYIGKQLDHFFPDGNTMRGRGDDIDRALDLALDRTEHSFSRTAVRGYSDGHGTAQFSHLHSDQYAQFLYYFSNSLWKLSENKPVCDKLICLNKALNGYFFSYKCGLPDIFVFIHSVGSIIGNAEYDDFLVILQNVTINTGEERPPKLGKGVYLAAGAKIIGHQPVGDRTSIGVDALIYDQAIPADKVVERAPNGEIVVRDRRSELCMAQQYFNVEIT